MGTKWIKCEPGVVVQVSATGQTSVRGGTYEVEDKYAKEALKRQGVTEVKDDKQANTKQEMTDAD